MISRRSGSRVSIHNRVRLNRCLEHQVSRVTLCPLGQPEKAIGRESQIEPWLASTTALLAASENKTSNRHHDEFAEKQRPHRLVATRAGCREALQSRGEVFLFDIPFYRTPLTGNWPTIKKFGNEPSGF